MQFYNYRSVKAISEYRYPQINRNHPNPSRPSSGRIAPSAIWRDEISHEPVPSKRKQRANNRAPDPSRAA